MQWPIICDLTRNNHRTPFILPHFRGVITKNNPSNLETSHRKRGTPHKRHTAILLVNFWPIIMRINYDVKARGKIIGTLHQLVFYSESVTHTDRIIGSHTDRIIGSHTDRIIGLVWTHLYCYYMKHPTCFTYERGRDDSIYVSVHSIYNL